MECLDSATLCRYLDQELDGDAAPIAAHLSVCERCAQHLRTLQEADATLRRAWPGPPLPAAPGAVCYSAMELSAYVDRRLPAPEAAHVEQHLLTCDACLQEVMAIHRTQSLLHRETWLAPPADLLSAKPGACTCLGALIIQVAQNGLKFLEALGLPEDVRLSVGGHLLPAGAFRGAPQGGKAAALLEIQQLAGELELNIKILHEEREAVFLTIQVRKRGRPLGHQRVELLRPGRMLYSAPTSASGETEALRLMPGEYTVRLPEEHLETQYILRFARGASVVR